MMLLVRVARGGGTAARFGTAGAAVAALLLVGIGVDQVVALRGLPARGELYGPNHASAYAYVAAHRQPGELIVSHGPPEAYLVLGSAPELRYLAGEAGSTRMARTLRESDEGRIVDYWAGMEAIQTVDELCTILADDVRAWAVVEDGLDRKAERRLGRGKEVQIGPMRVVLDGATREELATSEGVFVLRAISPDEWSTQAQRQCSRRLSS
jgi:hypothetical protein